MKIIAIILSVVTLFCIAGSSVSAGLLGDADGDGKITASDARLVLRYSAGFEENIDTTLCDMNSDGRIYASDARKIMRIASGLENPPVTTVTQTQSTTYGVLSEDVINPLPTPKTIIIDENNFNLTLVNASYRIPEDYVVQKAVAVKGYDTELDYRVAVYYQAMYDAAAREGIYLTPYSGYRRYSTQKTNYTNKTNLYLSQGYSLWEAQALAARIIMPPGSSEHNLGLAMDICGTSNSFDQTKAFSWLCEHAWQYGFILRYTKEKQLVTGVTYEPWHWRFVGTQYAKEIRDSGLCLEEWLAQKGMMPNVIE